MPVIRPSSCGLSDLSRFHPCYGWGKGIGFSLVADSGSPKRAGYEFIPHSKALAADGVPVIVGNHHDLAVRLAGDPPVMTESLLPFKSRCRKGLYRFCQSGAPFVIGLQRGGFALGAVGSSV